MKIISASAIGLFQLVAGANLRASFLRNKQRSLQEISAAEDPFLWLEDTRSQESLEWVETQNNATVSALEAHPYFDDILQQLEQNGNSPDRIPYFNIRHGLFYNFWRDEAHVRGIWRRTTMDSYFNDTTQWETILDFDKLSSDENENWVLSGITCLPPEEVRCMISLSRGGGDATVEREFDLEDMAFVEDGFLLPEAITFASWKDADTLWVSTDFGNGSLTTSGYSRFVKQWKRGTLLENATSVIEGSVDDVFVFGGTEYSPERTYEVFSVYETFFLANHYHLRAEDGEIIQLDVPKDASILRFFKNQMLLQLRSAWEVAGDNETFASGALLAIDFDDFLSGSRAFTVVFQPSERVALDIVSSPDDGIENFIVYTTLDNVISRMYRATIDEAGVWTEEEIQLPSLGSAGVLSRSGFNDTFYIYYSDFLTPTTLYRVHSDGHIESVKASPTLFDGSGVTVEQYHATSKDGTQIPYFIIKPSDLVLDGSNPTLLYGYGGFEVSLVPQYDSEVGAAWIERGGVYVVANIRGGGEFGPEWHQAAVRENHQTNFDDFIAVAENLIDRKITSPAHLGIRGGSQGGLLVGGSFVQRPDLFSAVACHVPLLDMRRFSKLLAGASWIDEYGDPDTDDWEDFISSWSPYHNLKAEEQYPHVFFQTYTSDDRVHPAHARKMAAKMLDMGHSLYFYEATEGGHGGGALTNQRAYTDALTYTYLWKMLANSDQPEGSDADSEVDLPGAEVSKQLEQPDLP
ncbi:Uncharacterized peptidase y4nA [Seminavis robusta]|uniref:Prolyl endopeptidase n=1 Tax=Seminavis robusta TaxID=568900 RepID=A0A9N8H4S7_9STRA|nr:Uncharacterized peptidase y4nA [Seminavis robusta]|eukprot:Sro12_g009520.1 Uncharacterized peptidase y4nA (747) ;mRNA; f:143101-145341